ncbi:hypothetical protein F2Q69_00052475 [Brassica cretica]|uniref:Uncharacterized protein n=1 Tax=Brassica cretica TaxID=69181 RepID=A0A8S9MWC6_BRACR|nr:hypothetical protein F2Q69_00052475 [Brassica cretica]
MIGKVIVLLWWSNTHPNGFLLAATYYREAMGIFLVSTLCRPHPRLTSTTDIIRNWIRNIEHHASDKCQQDSSGEQECQDYNLHVEEAFFSIGKDIKQRLAVYSIIESLTIALRPVDDLICLRSTGFLLIGPNYRAVLSSRRVNCLQSLVSSTKSSLESSRSVVREPTSRILSKRLWASSAIMWALVEASVPVPVDVEPSREDSAPEADKPVKAKKKGKKRSAPGPSVTATQEGSSEAATEFKTVIEQAVEEWSRLLAEKTAQKAKFVDKFRELKGKFKTAGEKIKGLE